MLNLAVFMKTLIDTVPSSADHIVEDRRGKYVNIYHHCHTLYVSHQQSYSFTDLHLTASIYS